MQTTTIYDWEDRPVGRISIQKEGLYFTLLCQCDYSGNRIPRIYGEWEGKRLNLGVCVPKNGKFERATRIPVKEFDAFSAKYTLHTGENYERFIPLKENGEFPSLHEIEEGRFTVRDHQPGILLRSGSDSTG